MLYSFSEARGVSAVITRVRNSREMKTVCRNEENVEDNVLKQLLYS